jgi:hypothetical protein
MNNFINSFMPLIYFPGGLVNSPILGETPTASEPVGSKYKWAGDTLILTAGFNLTTQSTEQGVTAHIVRHATTVTRLIKK